MTPFAALPSDATLVAALQVGAAAVLAVLGLVFLLPRPRGRFVPLGILCSVAAAVVAGVFVATTFADGVFVTPSVMNPSQEDIGQVLFWLFSAGAVGFGAVLVTQRNPARGALAFAFVVLSTCGLFLLLAAPFLMAATVVVYAGAIVVTFLFVLMLSHAGGPSDENDRSREPLLGSLAGFGFAGLVLFALHQSAPAVTSAEPLVEEANDRLPKPKGERVVANPPAWRLPNPPLTPDDRRKLLDAEEQLRRAMAADTPAEFLAATRTTRDGLAAVVGTIPDRLNPAASEPQTNPRIDAVLRQVRAVRDANLQAFDRIENKLIGTATPDLEGAKADAAGLRAEVLLLAGRGELPARNVAALGHLLYSEHLLAVELAGTLLTVATVGAVAIAGRRRGAAA